jgi:hypothetical protein
MSIRRRPIVWLLVALGTIFLLVTLKIIGRPMEFEFPNGYHGWVVVQYEAAECDRFKHAGSFLTLQVPPSGRACTSDPASKGWQYVRYRYKAPDGRTSPIGESNWGGGGFIWAASYSEKAKLERFFVGTEQELNASWDSKPKL